jgi:SAM-dependent methyltransferase
LRKIYRFKDNKNYWNERWEKSGVDIGKFKNLDIYPIKYTNLVVDNKNQKILEAGCGAGRLFFHYKNLGYDIEGIEYSKIAVENIIKADKSAKVIQGNVCNMPYNDNSFDVLLALGLYHNFEDGNILNEAIKESSRVLKRGGKILASVRVDNFENNLIEFIVKMQNKDKKFNKFHKAQFNKKDIEKLFKKYFLEIEEVYYARNVSFLFKFDIFRKKELKKNNFKEQEARSSGFSLNYIGNIIDKTLHKFFPKQFSNIMVVVAKKV